MCPRRCLNNGDAWVLAEASKGGDACACAHASKRKTEVWVLAEASKSGDACARANASENADANVRAGASTVAMHVSAPRPQKWRCMCPRRCLKKWRCMDSRRCSGDACPCRCHKEAMHAPAPTPEHVAMHVSAPMLHEWRCMCPLRLPPSCRPPRISSRSGPLLTLVDASKTVLNLHASRSGRVWLGGLKAFNVLTRKGDFRDLADEHACCVYYSCRFLHY